MTKNSIKILLIFFKIIIFFLFYKSFAQEKNFSKFFEGKWQGNLSGYIWSKNAKTINFTIEYFGDYLSGDAILYPFGLQGTGAFVFKTEEGYYNAIKKNYFNNTSLGLFLLFDVGESPHITTLYVVSPFGREVLNCEFDLENSIVNVNHIYEETSKFEGVVFRFSVQGKIYKIEKIKKFFPKDIKPNELIRTNEKTQYEIIMPSKDIIKIAQNTNAVIKSESLMEVMKGKIHKIIKKLKPKTKFEVHTPTSVIGVRGTKYEIEVENDGTTTVKVFDGEIELSDKKMRKTVLVKKKQKSVVKPNSIPLEPVFIDETKILKWWD
ncbi:MAG: FecR domain-containing protein [Endomicrobiia bacterium]